MKRNIFLHIKTEQGRDTVLGHCTSRHCQKYAYQAWSHLILNLWRKHYAPDKNALYNLLKGNNSKTEQGIVTVRVHCTLSHCQKHAYQVWSHLNLW